MVFPIVGGTQSTGYDIENSCLFNGANQYMSRTPSSAGNRRVFTFSCWFKVHSDASSRAFMSTGDDSGSNDYIMFQSGDKLRFSFGTESDGDIITDAVFRDSSAWTHQVWAVDTTQGTNSNRVKLYLNGTQETNISGTYPDQNYDTSFNNTVVQRIGARSYSATQYFDGYMSEINFIDGTALDASHFGETDDNGVWIPKQYTGSYGTNGFFMEFQQTGTSQNSSGIGADTSGNDNHFAVSALGANSPALDVPTNNFCTMIPANNISLSGGGNLSGATTRTGNWDAVHGSIGVTTGKWYFECRASRTEDNFRVIVGVVGDPENWGIGFNAKGTTGDPLSTFSNTFPFYGKGVWLDHWYDEDYNDSSTASVNSNNDIIQIALDMDNYKVWVGVNGQFKDNSNNNVSYADVAAGNSATVTIASGAYTDKTFFPAFWLRDDQDQDDNLADINFGGAISFNISSAVNDGAGRGKFEYDVPSGFFSLCTKNLANHG